MMMAGFHEMKFWPRKNYFGYKLLAASFQFRALSVNEFFEFGYEGF
jgi:hypothetical protein